ncbi:MAG: hypothetical protein ABSB28_10545 [Candidatus Bathyarchaeia archaeon]
MSVKGRVKEDLHAGKPWDVIYKRYRSKSQIYEGLTEWFEEVKGEITAKQDEAAGLDAKVEDLTSRVKGASTEHAGLLEKSEDLKEKCEQLSESVSSLEQRKATLDTHLNNLTSKIDDLASRGVTLEVVERIHTAQFESGEDLLGRVQTAQAHVRLREDEEKLRISKEKLEGTVNSLEGTVKGLQEKVTSAENKLDTVRDETAIYGTAVDAVKQLFRAGYKVEDISALREGLKVMEIKGDPEMSLKRFVDGLQRVKSLETLRKQNEEEKTKLEAIRRDRRAVEAELTSMKDTTVKALNEAREAAVTEVEKVEQEATAEIRGVLTNFKEDLKEWGEIKAEAGKLGDLIDLAYRLMGIKTVSPEILGKVSTSEIASLMERIWVWTTVRLPNEYGTLKYNEYVTLKYNRLNIPVVAEFLTEELKKRALEEAKKA